MNLNEMIEQATVIRHRDRFGPVTEEEFAEFPVKEDLITIWTEQGTSTVYKLQPVSMEEGSYPVIVNFHGGGFIKGRLDRDKLFCAKLVNELNCIILDVDYKLAPEHPFPVAYKEAYGILRWVYDHASDFSGDVKRVALLGHSAGGNLVVGAVMQAIEHGTDIPTCIGIEYPPLDLKTDPADKPRMGRDMAPERARLYNTFYCKPDQMGDYRVSPIYADIKLLDKFPRCLIITAGEDSLAAEAELFAEKMDSAGVSVTYHRFADCRHGFTINRMDDYEQAFDLFTSYLKGSFF